MPLILDIQGFKREQNKFLVKELAAHDGHHVSHYVFKPPFTFNLLSTGLQKQALWLIQHHHSLNWNVGFVPLHMFEHILQYLTSTVDCVYIKGREKAEYIRQFLQIPVIELPEHPALEKSAPKCFYHCDVNCMCALSNVYYLYDTFVRTLC